MSDMAMESESRAIAVIPAASVPTIFGADKEDILGKLRKELDGFEPDVTTQKGRQEIAKKAYAVARAKMNLVRLADGLKEDAQKTIKGVNAERRLIEERMDALRDQVRAPLDEYERCEKDRVAGHEVAIFQIEALSLVGPPLSSNRIAARLTELAASELHDRNWQEFEDKARKAFTTTQNALKVAHADAVQREAQEQEATRLRAKEEERQRVEAERLRKEREARIAAEAATKAKREAEEKAAREAAEAERKAKAERDAAAERERQAKETAARAEREKVEAEYRAKEAAERAERQRVAAEKQREADRIAAQEREERARREAAEAERRRIEAEAEKERREAEARAANLAHRKSVNRDVLTDLVQIGAAEDQAKTIITAIAKGEVRHLRIAY